MSVMNIGEEHGGGIVFFVDGTLEHGLVAAKEDLSERFSWFDAKAVCHDFVDNGYSDWFLPNKDQLNMLYLQKSIVGGFADYSTGYWSSSEFTVTSAWLQLFVNGFQSHGHKRYLNRVRAVRFF